MSNTFPDLFRKIPLVGPLVDCTLQNHIDTTGQTFIVLLLSTAPLWLGGLVSYATAAAGSVSLCGALLGTIMHGELFMYGTALLAPIFWVALVDPPGARVFPSKVAHMLLIALIEIIASVFFGLVVAGNRLNGAFVSTLSVTVFCASLVLLYLGTLYHASRLPDPRELFKQDENDFSRAYGEHRQ